MSVLSRSTVMVIVLSGATSLAACTIKNDAPSSTSAATHEYDPLFDAPQGSGVHADDIVGLWESTQTSAGLEVHLRMLFRDGRIQLANRCSGNGYETVTVGVTVQGTFANGKLSVTDKGGTVDAPTTAAGKPDLVCKASLSGPGDAQYALGAGKLQLLGLSLTKVTD